jgi:DNA-binding CsgD family transcriptional regulator
MTAAESLGTGVIVTDHVGHVVFTNVVADRLLSCRGDVTVRGGQLVACSARSTDSLRHLIRNAARAACGDGTFAGRLWNSNSTEVEALSILVCPLSSPAEVLPIPNTDGCALLLMNDPEVSGRVSAREVTRLYGLTSAETKLLCALLKGERLSDYAIGNGITLNTTKFYMKNILGKTGTDRQSDLIRLLMSNPLLHAEQCASD